MKSIFFHPGHSFFINVQSIFKTMKARVTREQAIVNRDELLKSAEALFDKTKHSNSMIEVHFLNEIGTGLGPTLEFYTLVRDFKFF